MRKIKRLRGCLRLVESLLWDLSNRWLKMVEGPGCTLNGEKIRSKVQKGQKVIDVRGTLTKCAVVCFIFFYAAKPRAVRCFFVFNFFNRFVFAEIRIQWKCLQHFLWLSVHRGRHSWKRAFPVLWISSVEVMLLVTAYI